ncbi:hypothetical protein [Plantactinospora sp. DSM 117369]
MPDIRNNKEFRKRAILLRDEAAVRGLIMNSAEATDTLAEHLAMCANRLGVTQQTILYRYLRTEEVVAFAGVLANASAQYRQTIDETEPMRLLTKHVGDVVSALGMVVKLATDHIETAPADTLGILTDTADAIAGLGAALREGEDASWASVDGPTVAYSRIGLERAIELIDNRKFGCPCRSQHLPEAGRCELAQKLAATLKLVKP